MAGKATWEYRGDPKKPALLVQFKQGTIRTPENISYTLHENKNKKRRILTAETERLNYVGDNFSPEALRASSQCRYFVGVRNKETGKMKVYDAEKFCMQPLMKESVTDDHQDQIQANRTYREKLDDLIEAFGTLKQKRALSLRRLNDAEKQILSRTMTKAADEIIESKGTELKEAVEMKEEEPISLFLPHCFADADKPEDVYPLNQLISPEEYASLENVAAAFKNITPEELQERTEKNQHCRYVLQELADLKFAKDIDKLTRILWYMDTLVKLSQYRTVKKKDLVALECPNIFIGNFLKNFTVPIFKYERVQYSITAAMKCKIVTHIIALALHVSDFQADLSILCMDLNIKEKRVHELAKAMRLKIRKRIMSSNKFRTGTHKMGTLELPLPPVYKHPSGTIRRKPL